MGGTKEDEFGLLKKFSCSTCLAVMESIEEKPQPITNIAKETKIDKKEVTECISFSEKHLLVKRSDNSYILSEKGREALKRFKEVSKLIC